MSKKNIAVIGNGVYGIALAFLFGKKHETTVFGREMKNEGEQLISDYGKGGNHYDYLIISITTRGLSDLLPKIQDQISLDTHIILAMKGLTANGLLPIEECEAILPHHRISVLSGPGFAEEIMGSVPVHLVLASESLTEEDEQDFLVDNLTLDFSRDVRGVSWCGVLKNIYAIGAGIASKEAGFDRSEYTRKAVHEMSVILFSLGHEKDTAHGPAGRGDMWVCTTPHSRNFRYGAGDMTLRDQAEGYNALLTVTQKHPSIIRNQNTPLLHQILKSTFTVSDISLKII